MSTKSEEKAQRLSLRRTLLSYGYEPLPNLGKKCILSGWPYITVTDDVLKVWNRTRRPSTGVRIANGLAVIDLDVNDDLVDDIAAVMQDVLPSHVVTGMPIRKTSGKRTEAWFMRVEEPFARLATPKFELEDGTEVMVEAFGGAIPRQFGVYGPHTLNADGEATRWYEWDGRGLADVPLEDLPAATSEQIARAVDAVTAFLIETGHKKVSKASANDKAHAEPIYDMDETMVFNLDTGEDDVTYEEVCNRVRGGEKLRCSAHPWLARGQMNRTKISVGIDKLQRVCFFDFEAWQTHYHKNERPPEDYTPQETDARLQELSSKLGEADPSFSLDKAMKEAGDAHAQALVLTQYYGLLVDKQTFAVPYDVTPEGNGILTIGGFKTAFAKYDHLGITSHGNMKVTASPAGIWLRAPQTKHIAGIKMRPDMEYPTFSEEGKLWVNTYRPPRHATEGGSPDMGIDFLRYLFPRREESEYFLDVLAHKIQNPHIPGPGLIFVATEYGTGRSTLKRLVERLFGSRYVTSPSYDMLTGRSSQSQFNVFLANALVVFIEEARSDSNDMLGYSARQHDYEVLKKLVDPRGRDVMVNQKFMPATNARISAAIWTATNHIAGFALPPDDRRFSALECGSAKAQDDPFWVLLNNWIEDDANVTAFYRMLMERDVSAFNPYSPMMTPMKRHMIAASSNDFDRAFKLLRREAPGDLFTLAQIKDWMMALRDRHDLSLPKGWTDYIKRIADDTLVATEIEDTLRVYARDPEAARRHGTLQGAMEELKRNDVTKSAGAAALANIAKMEDYR